MQSESMWLKIKLTFTYIILDGPWFPNKIKVMENMVMENMV